MKGWLTRVNPMVALVVLLSLLLMAAVPLGKAQAAPEEGGIEVLSKVGYQGVYKPNKMYPAALTLTNKTEADLTGELVLSVTSNFNNTTDYVVPVELPMGTAVDVTIGVSGNSVSKTGSRIRFFEGTYKSGKSVAILGKDYLEGRNLSSFTIGVVARDPDTLNFMPTLNQKGYDIVVLPIAPEELPKEAIMLDMLDTLVINDVATGQWDLEVVEAIKEWVVMGGTLVLSGGAGYAKTAEAFQSIAPLEATGTSTLAGVESLIAAGGGAELKSDGSITISTGNVTSGEIEISEQGVAVAASRSTGFGTVIYAAFDPSLEPMSTWPGSAILWTRLLQDSLSPLHNVGGISAIRNYDDNMLWNMNRLIDQFPSIKPPHFLLLLGMFGLYVLIVAPVLYILLAKADRREWAWWMIPALSIVMGILVFIFGASDKRSLSAHTIELIDVSVDGNAIVTGSTAIFSPTGGTVTATFGDKRSLRLYSDTSGSNTLVLNGQFQTILKENHNEAAWRSVPYWSTRKLWMDRRLADAEQYGALTIAHKVENGQTKMVVTNSTLLDLTHVSLLMNGQALPIGDLKMGESGTMTKPSAALPPNGYHHYAGTIFPYGTSGMNGSDDVWRRHRELTDIYFNRNNGGQSVNPIIVAYSVDHETQYLVNGSKVKSDNLKMWIQRLEPIEKIDSRVIVPAGVMTPIIVSSTLQSMDNYGNGVMRVSKGELVLDYMAPNRYEVAYDSLDVQFIGGYINPNVVWSIWHEASGEWMELGGNLGAPNEYLTNGQSIRIKLSASAEAETAFPYVVLEGEEL